MSLRKIVASMLFVGVFSSVGVFADETMSNEVDPVKAKVNPFSDCGLGAALFKNDVAAALSNVIWDLGTTAVTSGVSSPDTCGKDSTDVAQFILHTYPSVSEETAKGEGVHLTSLLTISGCSDNSHEAIISDIRVGFSSIISAEDYSEKSIFQKSEDYYNLVMSQVSGPHASQCDMS